MTFLEAAIELLRQARRPLSAKELTERAVSANLLSHVGRAPEATMQARLTQEVKKGGTPLVRVSTGVFGLSRYDRPAGEAKPARRAAAPEPEEQKTKRRRRRRGRGGRDAAAGDAPEPATVEGTPEGTPEEAIAAARLAGETADIDLDAMMPQVARRYSMADLPSDDTLAAEYAGEADGGVTAPVEGELVDERTADEDRPMLAEIQGGRERDRGRGRRKAKAERPPREKEKRGKGRGRAAEAPAAPAAERARPAERPRQVERARPIEPARAPEPTPPPAPLPPPALEAIHAPAAEAVPEAAPPSAAVTAPLPAEPPPLPAAPAPRSTQAVPTLPSGAATNLADIAVQMLKTLGDPRPVHSRQLAAMAAKRRLIGGAPEELWRSVKVALLEDARARQARGLRPRARHHGGSLFTLASLRLEDDLVRGEEALAQKADELEQAVRVALRQRLARLPAAAFGELCRAYLERAGWRDLEPQKRVDETVYLTARARRGAAPVRVLVGIRAGGGELGRRSVGELRAGVTVKQLDEGVLLAAGRLGGEGERERAAPGAPITVFDGDALAGELMRVGVGVVTGAIPVTYLDSELFAELLE